MRPELSLVLLLRVPSYLPVEVRPELSLVEVRPPVASLPVEVRPTVASLPDEVRPTVASLPEDPRFAALLFPEAADPLLPPFREVVLPGRLLVIL